MDQITHLHDVPSDVLKAILRSHPVFSLRTVCKGLKTRIENFPEISISLSENGSQNVTADFLRLFKGKVTIGCNQSWSPTTGWFKAVLDAIRLGLIVERIVSLDVNFNTIQALSSDLRNVMIRGSGACESSKINRLSLSLTVCSKIGLGRSISALTALVEVVRMPGPPQQRPPRGRGRRTQRMPTVATPGRGARAAVAGAIDGPPPAVGCVGRPLAGAAARGEAGALWW